MKCCYGHDIDDGFGPFDTLDAIREANADAGFHFFSPSTLRFFGSQPADRVWAGRFFIDSTQQPPGAIVYPRRWTIRVAHDDGSVCTMGEFEQYETREEAEAAVHELWRLRKENA